MGKYVVIRLGFLVVIGLATTLIGVIVLRSPDTHANLHAQVNPSYARTDVATLGSSLGQDPHASQDFALSISNQAPWQGDQPLAPGKRLFLQAECATCHGIDALGGPVGPSLAGASPDVVRRMVREGRGGMLAFPESQLSDANLDQIAAYLGALERPRSDNQKIAQVQRITFDPSISKELLLKGKVALRRSCGACHNQPTKEDILRAFKNDAGATSLVADMVQEAGLNVDDATNIAYYILALRNGADPVNAP